MRCVSRAISLSASGPEASQSLFRCDDGIESLTKLVLYLLCDRSDVINAIRKRHHKRFGERIAHSQEVAIVAANYILVGDQLVDIKTDFPQKLELFTELVELRRSIKEVVRQALATGTGAAEMQPQEFAMSAIGFDRLEQRDAHDLMKLSFSFPFQLILFFCVDYLVPSLSPRDVDGDPYADEATDSLKPSRKVDWLRSWQAPASLRQARHEHPDYESDKHAGGDRGNACPVNIFQHPCHLEFENNMVRRSRQVVGVH